MCVRSFPFFLFWAALMLASWRGGVTVKYVDDYEKVPDQQKEVINNYFKRTT